MRAHHPTEAWVLARAVNKLVMQSESVAAKPTQPGTAAPSDRVADERSPRAERCFTADHGESAAKYLFKLSHDVILSLDRIGNILCINQRGVQLSGYSESELHGEIGRASCRERV